MQQKLTQYQPEKDIISEILGRRLKDPKKTAQLRSKINYRAIRYSSKILMDIEFNIITKAVFNIKEDYKYRHKFSKESLVKALIWKRICNIRSPTSIIRLLSQHREIAENLGFGKKTPQLMTLLVFERNLLKIRYMDDILLRTVSSIKKEARKYRK